MICLGLDIGTTHIKAGLFDWLYVSELVGVILMYIGFLKATTSPMKEQKVAPGLAD